METRIIEREGGFVAQFFKFGAWCDSWGTFACRADAEREIAALTSAKIMDKRAAALADPRMDERDGNPHS
jgi:hypothetical protein